MLVYKGGGKDPMRKDSYRGITLTSVVSKVKAFDSVEYTVLLEKLFDVEVNGKMWRLLKSWYNGGSCQVSWMACCRIVS